MATKNDFPFLLVRHEELFTATDNGYRVYKSDDPIFTSNPELIKKAMPFDTQEEAQRIANSQPFKKATALQTNILAANKLNEVIPAIIEYEKVRLLPLMEKDIFKIDGSLKAKYQFNKMSFDSQEIEAYGFKWWVRTTYYTEIKHGEYRIVINVNVSGGGADKNGVNSNSSSHGKTIPLFSVKETTLIVEHQINLSDYDVRYDEETILKAANNVKEAKTAYELAVGAVPYQFRECLYITNIR